MENKDFNFEQMRKRMENYEEAPRKELWENIDKQIHSKNIYLKTAIGVSSFILLAFVGILVFTPNTKEESKPIAQTIKVEKTTQKEPLKKTKKNLEKTKKNSEKTKKNSEKTKTFSEENIVVVPTNKTIVKTEAQTPEIKVVEQKVIERPIEKKIVEKVEVAPKVEIVEEKIVEKAPEAELDIERTKLFIPNAFTPSTGDENSIFKPSYIELQDYRMNIYSSNGTLVFTTNNIEEGWNGTYKNNPQPMGVYVYVVKFTNKKGITSTQKGELMLIR